MTTRTINSPITYSEATKPRTLMEGLFPVETFSDGSIGEVLQKFIPMRPVERYVKAAMNLARVKQLDDGTSYASVPQLRGTWANDACPEAALKSLQEVVFDWIIVKIAFGDRDLPVLEGIDLNAL